MLTGTIKWFSPAKGYGFITKEDGTDVFVHFSGLAKEQDRRLFPGDKVHFNEGEGDRGPKAVNVIRFEKASESAPASEGE